MSKAIKYISIIAVIGTASYLGYKYFKNKKYEEIDQKQSSEEEAMKILEEAQKNAKDDSNFLNSNLVGGLVSGVNLDIAPYTDGTEQFDSYYDSYWNNSDYNYNYN